MLRGGGVSQFKEMNNGDGERVEGGKRWRACGRACFGWASFFWGGQPRDDPSSDRDRTGCHGNPGS